jgi:hypothetical protein
LHNNTKTPWKYNVGGANVFQKEKGEGKGKGEEKEEEMRSPSKWRTTRDSPEQGINLVSTGVRGECSSRATYTEYLD